MGTGGPARPPQSGEDGETAAAPRGVGLRVAAYLLAMLTILSIGMATLILLVKGPEATRELIEQGQSGPPEVLLIFWLEVALAPVVLVATLGFVGFFDRRPISDLGLSWPASAAAQTAAAAGLAAAALGLWRLAAGVWVDFQPATFSAAEQESLAPWLPLGASGLLAFAGGFLLVAFLQELMFRGYVYAVLRERWSWVHAAGLSSLLSVLSLWGATEARAPALLNALLIGVVLAALRERTGSLLMGVVLVATWNLVLGCLLSLPVSGVQFPRLGAVEAVGPEAVTGGAFGPEGGWLVTAVMAALLLALVPWVEAAVGEEGDGPANGAEGPPPD